jgi:hypothetical protein
MFHATNINVISIIQEHIKNNIYFLVVRFIKVWLFIYPTSCSQDGINKHTNIKY